MLTLLEVFSNTLNKKVQTVRRLGFTNVATICSKVDMLDEILASIQE